MSGKEEVVRAEERVIWAIADLGLTTVAVAKKLFLSTFYGDESLLD